jgi:hypothetical protein
MDERALRLLNELASACKSPKLTPEGWGHVHQFTLYMYRTRLHTHPDFIKSLLMRRGCSRQKASWVLQHYQQGLALLQLFDNEQAKTR